MYDLGLLRLKQAILLETSGHMYKGSEHTEGEIGLSIENTHTRGLKSRAYGESPADKIGQGNIQEDLRASTRVNKIHFEFIPSG